VKNHLLGVVDRMPGVKEPIMRYFVNISESLRDIKISHYTIKILVKEMLFELIVTRKETKTRFKIFSSKNTF